MQCKSHCLVLLWGLLYKEEISILMTRYYYEGVNTSTECCEFQVATCRCDLKCSTEHSSDCGSVATEFLKISELYRHNCACGSDW